MSRHGLVDSPSFLLCVIDVFSKYAFVRGIASKHAHVVAEAFKSIFKESSSSPVFVCSDSGKEFINSMVKNTLLSHGVEKVYQTTGNNKAAVVERFISSLRLLLTKFLVHNGLNSLSDENLQKIVSHYNNRKHGSTHQKPVDVWKASVKTCQKTMDTNQRQLGFQITSVSQDPSIWLDTYQSVNDQLSKRMRKPPSIKFVVGDLVRINRFKETFHSRINSPRFTTEIFKIARVFPARKDQNDVVMYSLKGFNAFSKQWEMVQGKFYQHELTKSINRRHLPQQNH